MHPSTLDWEIPWIEKPGRLQSMGVTKDSDHLVTKQQLCSFVFQGGHEF